MAFLTAPFPTAAARPTARRDRNRAPAPPPRPADLFSVLSPTELEEAIEVELVSGAGVAERIRLDAPIVLIGRASGCDLRLTDPDVGGRHALLISAAGRYFVADLGGRTGILVNGKAVSCGWFGPGDELSVGPYRLRNLSIKAAGDAPCPAPALLSRSESPPVRLGLRLPRAGRKAADAAIVRPLTLVGRSSACKVRLSDPSVSNVHACLLTSASGVLAFDLLSRGGLVVNGRTVRSARLAAGDQLRLGSQRLEVVESHAETGANPAGDHAATGAAGKSPSTESRVRDGRDGDSGVPLEASLSEAAKLIEEESRGSAGLAKEMLDILLPFPDEMLSAELDRFADLSSRIAKRRLDRIDRDAGGDPSDLSVDLLEAERAHCREMILSVLSELAGRRVGC